VSLAYLQSHHCPRLDQFPSLRVLETCLYASAGCFTLEEFGIAVELHSGAKIFQAFADSFLSTASPSNNIEHIRLYIFFDGMTEDGQWGGSEEEIENEAREGSRVFGLQHLDRALSGVQGNFHRLKKVTIVVGQAKSLWSFGDWGLELLRRVHNLLFADWELTRSGKLEVIFQIGESNIFYRVFLIADEGFSDDRKIDNVTDWVQANVKR
jgi:hypothetical protein